MTSQANVLLQIRVVGRVDPFVIQWQTDLMAERAASITASAVMSADSKTNQLALNTYSRPTFIDTLLVSSDQLQTYNWPIFQIKQTIRAPTNSSCFAEIRMVLNDEAYSALWEVPADKEVLILGNGLQLIGDPIVTNIIYAKENQSRFTVDVLQAFHTTAESSDLIVQYNLVNRGERTTGENLYLIAINVIYIMGLSAGKER